MNDKASDWKAIVVFPNFRLRQPIDADFAAIVPVEDERIVQLRSTDKNFNLFLSRFTDTFGRAIHPSVMLVRKDGAEAFTHSDAVSSLRDVIALSVVPFNLALGLNDSDSSRTVWSDYFFIFPWSIAKNDPDGLIGHTPALLGLDATEDFHGQSTPSLFPQVIEEHHFDRPLRSCLLRRWRDHYSGTNTEWSEVALFRALNMAFNASTQPGGTEITYLDVGRQIALWVSAFEILIHPGADGKADFMKVYELLKGVEWSRQKSVAATHACYSKPSEPIVSINACWLYGHLYKTRNNFLHGNPVTIENLKLPNGRPLYNFAAPLFRAALSAFLPLTFSLPEPDPSNTQEYEHYLAACMRYNGPRHEIEEALLRAQSPPDGR
jgi:hypothetical protein